MVLSVWASFVFGGLWAFWLVGLDFIWVGQFCVCVVCVDFFFCCVVFFEVELQHY